jgi:hypothetical protein
LSHGYGSQGTNTAAESREQWLPAAQNNEY